MKIYYVPIEPYETRYTADWIKQFTNEFEKNGIEYEVILGNQITSVIKCGSVLDACGTNIYKLSQLTKLINLIISDVIKDGDCIFFADAWFPGVESLFYIRNLTKINFKIFGILHAGTYDKNDFTYREGMRPWGKFMEAGWLMGFDKIFVATFYHKELIRNYSIAEAFSTNRIIVTGLPFYAENLRNKYGNANKEDIVVFPHRLNEEKRPELFDELSTIIHNLDSNIKCIKTLEVTNTRDEYFRLLAKSKVMVSFALQETFGYSTLESMALGNKVFVPNDLSYVETVPECDRYNYLDLFEMAINIIHFIKNYKSPNYDLSVWTKSIKNMLNIIIEESH